LALKYTSDFILITISADWMKDVKIYGVSSGTPSCGSASEIANRENFVQELEKMYSVWPNNIRKLNLIRICQTGADKLALAEMKVIPLPG